MMDGLREKVVKGLACCLPETMAEAELTCEDCPYKGNCGDASEDVSLRIQIVDDIRTLLKAEEVTSSGPSGHLPLKGKA